MYRTPHTAANHYISDRYNVMTVLWYTDGMRKKKTTVYIDSDVLTATKAAALTSERSESAVIEDALRSYLRSEHGDAVRDELQELFERVALTSDLDEDAALAQAVGYVCTQSVSSGGRHRCVVGELCRVVFYTNLFVTAVTLREGVCAQLLLAARTGGYRLVVSPMLLDERSAVLVRPKFRR